MTEQHEPTGGIRGQLRNLAERGSFDGEWGVLRPQLARVGREVSIPGDDAQGHNGY